jgi:histidinol-phosphatase (PHP family)
MEYNYHTHTPLCGHATGEMREYIEKAIEGGIKRLGFSDHSVQFYDGGYVSGMRMRPDQAEGYVREVKRLSEEYRSEIDVFVGFEAEYFPSIFPRLRQFCRDNGVDYLIMGQHCLTCEPTSPLWGGSGTSDPAFLTLYVDELLEGLSTGSFTYVCHPDMFRFTGDDETYKREITRLCKGANALGIPFEINLLGLRDGRHYPCDKFFTIASENGCSFVIGCDAHSPESLVDKRGPALAAEFMARNGISAAIEPILRKI